MSAKDAPPRLFYEALVPERVPYWVFWPLCGLLIFVFGEAMLRVLGGRDFLVTQLVFCIGLAGAPTVMTYVSRSFWPTLHTTPDGSSEGLAVLLWVDPGGQSLLDEPRRSDFESWCVETHRRVFSLATARARIVVAATAVAGMATVALAGLPFQNGLVNIGSAALFIVLLAMSGHAASVIIGLLVTLTELARRQVRVPFFRLPHPAFSALLHYYSTVAVLVSGAYVVLAIGIWEGPYGFSLPMMLWLTVLAAFPLMTSTWSVVEVHKLLQRTKQIHLDAASAMVRRALAAAQTTGGASDLEALHQAMTVQSMVQDLREWPVPLSATLTFAAALGTAALQGGALAMATLFRL